MNSRSEPHYPRGVRERRRVGAKGGEYVVMYHWREEAFNRFLREAIENGDREPLYRKLRFRRNVYVVLFGLCFLAVPITAFFEERMLAASTAFAGAIALVVTTKYNTHLFFLQILNRREEEGKRPPKPPWEE